MRASPLVDGCPSDLIASPIRSERETAEDASGTRPFLQIPSCGTRPGRQNAPRECRAGEPASGWPAARAARRRRACRVPRTHPVGRKAADADRTRA
eukprot:gene13273-biopygen3495